MGKLIRFVGLESEPDAVSITWHPTRGLRLAWSNGTTLLDRGQSQLVVLPDGTRIPLTGTWRLEGDLLTVEEEPSQLVEAGCQ